LLFSWRQKHPPVLQFGDRRELRVILQAAQIGTQLPLPTPGR
jgi:hypothetical protein